ncbi:hypothetical protein [Pseudodesulfovibrio pelocollis]|uniref:hypothetical protein n=1 Tax=Pseudodesulfovibrio pelocollis TaxID=3051432 RepID=UPI00255ABD63|nr:hypothetical protein [Pseudodesulfovibrio sp. SB368]
MERQCYVDVFGEINFLDDMKDSEFEIVQQNGFKEVWILGPEIGGEQEVIEEYELHESLEALQARLAS